MCLCVYTHTYIHTHIHKHILLVIHFLGCVRVRAHACAYLSFLYTQLCEFYLPDTVPLRSMFNKHLMPHLRKSLII